MPRIAGERKQGNALAGANPCYNVNIDHPELVTTSSNILKSRNEMHRKLFPEQYDASGNRVRDFYGDPIAS